LLKSLPRDLYKQALPVVTVHADALVRVSRYGSGEPFLGRARANRFDANHRDRATRFRTLYWGFDVETALAARTLSALRIRLPEPHSRAVSARAGLGAGRPHWRPLKRLGGTGAISTITPYTLPRQWARAVHDHPAGVDGIRYVSRDLNTEFAVVIFDRAVAKIAAVPHVPLPRAPGIVAAVGTLGIAFARK